MKKTEGIRWSSLEADDEIKFTPFPTKGQSWYCFPATVKMIFSGFRIHS